MIPSPPSHSFINPHQIAGAAWRERPMSPFREGKGAIYSRREKDSAVSQLPTNETKQTSNKKTMPPPSPPPNDLGSYLGQPDLPAALFGCFGANLPSSRRISTQSCLATKPYLVPAKETARSLASLSRLVAPRQPLLLLSASESPAALLVSSPLFARESFTRHAAPRPRVDGAGTCGVDLICQILSAGKAPVREAQLPPRRLPWHFPAHLPST